MKRILISSVAAATLVSAVNAASSGVFVGVNAGVPITTPSYGGFLEKIKSNLPENGVGWAAGLSVGYKQALSESYGLRYYVDYNYNQSFGEKSGGSNAMISKVKANITQQLITANVDFYYDFAPSFGVYAGIGVGYQLFKPTWTPTLGALLGGAEMTIGGEQKGGLALPLNLGFYYNVNEKQQLSLGAKIPLVGYDYKTTLSNPAMGVAFGGTEGTSTLRSYIVQLGYSYTF